MKHIADKYAAWKGEHLKEDGTIDEDYVSDEIYDFLGRLDRSDLVNVMEHIVRTFGPDGGVIFPGGSYPLGLKPEIIHIEERMEAIRDAAHRAEDVGMRPSPAWISEYHHLLERACRISKRSPSDEFLHVQMGKQYVKGSYVEGPLDQLSPIDEIKRIRDEMTILLHRLDVATKKDSVFFDPDKPTG